MIKPNTLKDKDKVKDLIVEAVSQGKYPQFVYKYRISDINKNAHFNSIITNNSMMFSAPNAFNDPFDCQLQPVLFPNVASVRTFLNRVLPGAQPQIINNRR